MVVILCNSPTRADEAGCPGGEESRRRKKWMDGDEWRSVQGSEPAMRMRG